ncbi:NAD(P)-dependent oxidoreductase [Leptothrix sp. BB-4]
MNRKQKVGLIGLGAMGRGSATQLINKGFELVGFDVRQESLDWLSGIGGTPAATLAALAGQVEIVVSFVVNAEQTEQVLLGPDGLVGRLPAGSIFISCSTMDPAYVEKLASRLAAKDIQLVDAPVTGGPGGALQGTLTIMGSGEKDAFEQARPVLEAMGKRIHYLGQAGTGAKMKVINQLLVGANLAAAAEAMALAKHLDVPLQTTLDILSSGAANSWMLSDRGPKMIAEGYDDVAAAIDIFVKDLSLVLDTTREARFTAPLAHMAYLSFIEAAGRGLGGADGASIMTNYARRTRRD